ncbi:MAG: PmoA family protein [Candidatus Poribacteria bacterium]|nr:PmoA family protein [Candidatus Poribacteria bacterium]
MALILTEISGSTLSLADGDNPILTYHYGPDLYKPYFHPVYAPNRQIVTADSPEDHRHHRGLCFAWGNVNGINYWAEVNCDEAVRGRIVHREFREKNVSADLARFVVVNDWVAPDGTKPIEAVCHITVHQPHLDMHVIDFCFELQARSTDVIMGTPPAYHGLCYRAAEMEYRRIINSNSRIGELEAQGKPAQWCQLGGVLGEEPVGVAIFDHPSNLRHPTQFFALDETFGFISTSFAYDEPYTLPSCEVLALKYRVLIHLGDLFTFDLWKHYEEYSRSKG